MQPEHLVVIPRLSDPDLHIPDRESQIISGININSIHLNPVFIRCTHQFKGQVQPQLVLGHNLCTRIGVGQYNTVDDCGILHLTPGNSLDNSLF